MMYNSSLGNSTLDYPPRLQLAQRETPLQFLPRASQRWGQGKRLWIKRDDLTGSTLTGNKVRKLEFFAAHAKEFDFDTLITCGALQSNHARATAGVCAQLGLQCELILRGEKGRNEGNTFLDFLFGAKINVVEPSTYMAHLDEQLNAAAERHRKHGRNALVIPTGGSNALGIWGYIAVTDELLQDFQVHELENPTVICASGSGGTQAGLTLGFALHSSTASVLGMAVCEDSDWFNQKILSDIRKARQLWPSLPDLEIHPVTIDHYVGKGYGIANSKVYSLIGELARLEGIVLDPVYTGKAFHGLVSEIANGRFEDTNDIVFIHTGGIFGLFPHAQEFSKL